MGRLQCIVLAIVTEQGFAFDLHYVECRLFNIGSAPGWAAPNLVDAASYLPKKLVR